MKLVSYVKEGREQLAILANGVLYDMDSLHPELPSTMGMFLNYWDEYFPLAQRINESIKEGSVSLTSGVPYETATPISPIPFPSSYRKASSSGDSEIVHPVPTFQFLNHFAIQGIGEVSCMPDHLSELDFEAGVAVVISTPCRNITAGEAGSYIGGYMLVNSLISNNDNNLAGKDIATVMGPFLITPDELDSGEDFNFEIKISVNSEQVLEINFSEVSATFASLVESCAYGANLQPGDVIVKGIFDGGYYSTIADGSRDSNWLKENDIIEIEVENLGMSTATIVAEDSDFSLLAG